MGIAGIIGIIFAIMIVAGVLAWFFVLKKEQKSKIMKMLHIKEDFETAYPLSNSYVKSKQYYSRW